MTVKNCLNKLVAVGKISRQAADEAMNFHQRMQGNFSGSSGPVSADAAGALEAARLLEEQALKKKASLAKQAITAQALSERVTSHPRGIVAGTMSVLTKDIWSRGGQNVQFHTEVVMGELAKRFNDGLEAYKTRWGGLVQDISGPENMIREIRGVDTGDPVAKTAAKGYRDMVEYGTRRAEEGGKLFDVLDNWFTPQFWAPHRIRDSITDQVRGQSTKARFLADLRTEIEAQNVFILDKETGRPTTAAKLEARLEEAYRDMLDGSGSGGFSPQARTIHFAESPEGAEAWIRLQENYGGGRDIMALLRGHMNNMAREIALIEVLGPQHGATVRMLRDMAREAAKDAKPASRFHPARMIENEGLIAKTYDVLTGRINEIESEIVSGIFGGLRNLFTASYLGGGVVSAVTGDSVTMAVAANHLGMSGTSAIARGVQQIFADPKMKELAAQLNIVSHAMMDVGIGTRAFDDAILDRSTMAKLANFVIRAQGMQAWTEAMKRGFTMELMGHIARDLDKPFDALDKPMQNFYTRHGISPAEWDVLRKTPPTEAMGAKFFDTSAVKDRALGDKLMGGILEERSFAILEPDARVQAMTSNGMKRGTLWGEVIRSGFQFKSFSMTMATTHLMRAFTGEYAVGRSIQFLLLSFVGGAAAIQAKQMLSGKDPRDMTDVKFWAASLIQGGGLGIYGDLLQSAGSRTGRSPLADVGGPLIGFGEDLAKLTPNIRKYYEGEDVSSAAGQAFRMVKHTTPFSNLWYTRLATDRLIWDQLQQLVDPNYRKSFRRMEQKAREDYNQRFYWRPGETEPERAPNLGAAVP
jgi:hypothetical protein